MTTQPQAVQSSVDLAEMRLLYRFRCFVAQIQPQEREDFFHPINTDDWMRGFTAWLEEEREKYGASND